MTMIKATLDRQLMVYASNQIGSLAEITSIISSSGINLVAICAYSIQDKVAIMLVTEDNNAARKLLEAQDCKVQEEEVVLLTLDNKPGALQAVTERIAESDIDLKLIYGSSDPTAQFCRIVLIAENNLDVMMIIKTELERS
jgi:hypothetical protein